MTDNELNILTDEQLVKMAQEGSNTAEEILLEKYKSVVRNKRKMYYIVGADDDDVVQEAMIGLFKAIRGYDPEREVGFNTFAHTCINRQILSAIKKANRLKHQPLNDSVSFNNTVSKDENDVTFEDTLKSSVETEPESNILLKEAISNMNRGDGKLFSDFEWQVLTEKIKGKDYTEIAKELDKTSKSVDNALQRIKKKINSYFEK